MLDIERLTCMHGAVVATHEVSLTVNDAEIVTLIGANGAGKSSIVGAVSGLVKFTGTIRFEGSPLPRSAASIMRRGVVQVPEGRRVFPDLTVAENLAMGAYRRRDNAAIRRDEAICYELFPILAERKKALAGILSGGQQQMLAVARALMGAPRLLMLDEPSHGLAPPIVRQLIEHIRTINQELGITILLIEQSIGVALEVAQRAYVLDRGRVAFESNCEELRANPKLRTAYLGL